jgi:hypothetical protein
LATAMRSDSYFDNNRHNNLTINFRVRAQGSLREGISEFELCKAREFFPDDYFIINLCTFYGKRNKIDAVYSVEYRKKFGHARVREFWREQPLLC